jgi:DNA processing protein
MSLAELPPQLAEIPQPPESLYLRGEPLPTDGLYLAVVGSRNHSRYAADACERLISGLAGSPLIIVSGLALGIDSVAHRAALSAGMRTVAFPGSGLDDRALYPARNLHLAQEILEAGGTLVSEYDAMLRAAPWCFPQRNRLMAGISQAVLIIEAGEKSGTLITARMALDYNRDVLAVPGAITSERSRGTNALIRSGAMPITCADDILEVFGLAREKTLQPALPIDLSDNEKILLAVLDDPATRDALLASTNLSSIELFATLSQLEIKGMIREEFGEFRRV